LPPAQNPAPVREVVAPLRVTDRLDLRVFIDGPVLEIFANGQCVTAQVFPSRADAIGVAAFGQAGRLVSAEAWTMRAARFVDKRRE
jgi:hypothetical protein